MIIRQTSNKVNLEIHQLKHFTLKLQDDKTLELEYGIQSWRRPERRGVGKQPTVYAAVCSACVTVGESNQTAARATRHQPGNGKASI